MNSTLIERIFAELFRCGPLAPEVAVLWHSGEPLTLPPSYYDDAISRILDLKASLAPNEVSMRFGIQTNGVLINDEWCEFFKRHANRIDVGVSCDGPEELHDLFRVNWSGRTSHSNTLRGMDLLHTNGIKYKLIAVVTRQTLRQPERFYRFFYERRGQLSGFHFNIMADANSAHPDLGYSSEDRGAYYAFYRRLLELCHGSQGGDRPFEILNLSQGSARILASKDSHTSSFFEQAAAPLRSLNVDARGNVTTFYAGLSTDVLRDLYEDGQGLSLGNILETSLEDMVTSEKLKRMRQDFATSRRACEESCEYYSACPGGFDLLKRQKNGSFQSCETAECVIHVKTLVDALLDDMQDHVKPVSVA